MSSVSNTVVIPNVFADIVDSIRATGTITDISIASGIATVTSVNELTVGEIVQMDGVDYRIRSASSSQFTVKATALVASSWKALAPYYMYGHLVEIVGRLLNKNYAPKLKWQKYPVVILLLDIPEDRTDNEQYCKAPIEIRLAHITENTYMASERYTNTFIPVLHPIYEDLMTAIAVSSDVIAQMDSRNHIPHTKEDKLFWGRESINGNSANKNADYVDAIEININELRFQKPINCIK